LPHGQKILFDAYSAVENVMQKVAEYVNEWIRQQTLWDLQPEVLYDRLGVELERWIDCIHAIKKSRANIDTQETRIEIFPVIIDYTKVQSKVSMKYDYWHREVLQKFGSLLGTLLFLSRFYRYI